MALRRPLRRGGLSRRGGVPRFWRNIVPALAAVSASAVSGPAASAVSGPVPAKGAFVPEARLNGWLLVLAAKKVPHVFLPSPARPRLYVPPLAEGFALHEITAFERERPAPEFTPPRRDNMPLVVLFLLSMVVWHGVRWGWFPDLRLPAAFPSNPGEWAARFGLDVYRTRVLHEWWRTVTALTLHADGDHVAGNALFGLFFFIPLCRRAGLGAGVLSALLAGATGNACNALFREANVLSLGFSTALFGAVGSLCAFAAGDILERRAEGETGLLSALARKLMPPLAAGLALLGFLGGGGEARTDYRAHIWGFVCGLVAGSLLRLMDARLRGAAPAAWKAAQAGMLALAAGIVAVCWRMALG